MTYKQPTSRLTNQKQAILQAVLSSHQHLTAEATHQQLQKQLPRLSLATVYRNLHQFAEQNQLSRTLIQGIWHFESPKPPHYHVICLACQKVSDIDSPPASDIETHLQPRTNYTLTSHQLTLFGLCPKCQQPHT